MALRVSMLLACTVPYEYNFAVTLDARCWSSPRCASAHNSTMSILGFLSVLLR